MINMKVNLNDSRNLKRIWGRGIFLRRAKSKYDEIKEKLEGKSLQELRDLLHELLEYCKKNNKPKCAPILINYVWYGTGKIPNLSRTELTDSIADIASCLGVRDFNYKKYMETLFKGRQKGRAYKSFKDH